MLGFGIDIGGTGMKAALVAADLRRLQDLHDKGLDDASFELGSDDLSSTLRLPHQLHGRERERTLLTEVFTAVSGSTSRSRAASSARSTSRPQPSRTPPSRPAKPPSATSSSTAASSSPTPPKASPPSKSAQASHRPSHHS